MKPPGPLDFQHSLQPQLHQPLVSLLTDIASEHLLDEETSPILDSLRQPPMHLNLELDLAHLAHPPDTLCMNPVLPLKPLDVLPFSDLVPEPLLHLLHPLAHPLDLEPHPLLLETRRAH